MTEKLESSDKYACFISYKHGNDTKLVEAVHKALHKLAKPWWKVRALRVFRDETILASSDDLNKDILDALSSSSFLLLFASPESAESIWVQKEIFGWLRKDPEAKRILIVLSSGELIWDASLGSFDPVRSTSLPKELIAVIKREPLWVDLRSEQDSKNFQLSDIQFRSALLKIAARLHGCTPEEIDGEDLRFQRQVRRLLSGGIMLISLLAIFAWHQRGQAVFNRVLAEAGQQASLAQLSATKNPRESPLHVVKALDLIAQIGVPPDRDILFAARQSLHLFRWQQVFDLKENQIRGFTLLEPAQQLLVVSRDTLRLIDMQTGLNTRLPITRSNGDPLGTEAVAIDRTRQLVYVTGVDFDGQSRWMRIDLESSEVHEKVLSGFTRATGIGLLPNGQTLVSDRSGLIVLLDNDGNLLREWQIGSGGRVFCHANGPFCAIADKSPYLTDGAARPGESITSNGKITLISPHSSNFKVLESPHSVITQLLFDNPWKLWSIGSEGLAQSYAIRGEHIEREGELVHAFPSPATAIAASNERIAVGARDGLIRIWLGDLKPALELKGHITAIRGLAFSDDPCLLWSISEDGHVRNWNLCLPFEPQSEEASWKVQSSNGHWVARVERGQIHLSDGISIELRSVSCAEEYGRNIQLLAVSTKGDVAVKCLNENENTGQVEILWNAPNNKITILDGDKYQKAKFLEDGSLIISTGFVLPDMDEFSRLNEQWNPKTQILHVSSQGKISDLINLGQDGLVMAISENPGSGEVFIGTSIGVMIRLEKNNWKVRERIAIWKLVDTNNSSSIGIKEMACCLNKNQLAIVTGWDELSASAMNESFRDRLLIYDLSGGVVIASEQTMNQQIISLALAPGGDELAVLFGSDDTAGSEGKMGGITLYNPELKPTSPMYPATIGFGLTLVYAADGKSLSLVGQAERRNLITDFAATEKRLRELSRQEELRDQIYVLLEQVDREQNNRNWLKLIELCSAVLELDAKHVSCFIYRGNAYINLDQVDNAMNDYNKAFDLDPYNTFLPLLRTKAFIKAKHFEEAELEATRSIEQAHLLVRPPLLVGDAEKPTQTSNKAIYNSLRAIANKGQAELWLLRARIRLELGKISEARSDLDEVARRGLVNKETEILHDWLNRLESRK